MKPKPEHRNLFLTRWTIGDRVRLRASFGSTPFVGCDEFTVTAVRVEQMSSPTRRCVGSNSVLESVEPLRVSEGYIIHPTRSGMGEWVSAYLTTASPHAIHHPDSYELVPEDPPF